MVNIYLSSTGQFYGRGIPEMLKDVQNISNEEVNQRLDAKAITLNPRFAVIEKSVLDPRDFEGGAGSVIRMRPQGGITDINNLFQRIDMGTIDRAAFIEPQEWERWAQERTSVNRITLGTSGQMRDTNQTLGGMELNRSASSDKFTFLGMLSENDFQYEVCRAYWKLIYQNYTPEDVALAIGEERARTFVPMTPEQVENGYQFYPVGVYSMENKALRQARLGDIRRQFLGAPWVDDLAFFEAELQNADEDPQKFKVQEAEAMQIMGKAQQMAAGMAQQVLSQRGAGVPQSSPQMPQESPVSVNGGSMSNVQP